jgi:3',5'-cyclic AMP phosphodiesterase CpdA
MASIKIDNHQNFVSDSPVADDPSPASAIALAHISDPHISCMNAITTRDLLGKRLLGFLRWKLHRGSRHGDGILSALQTDLSKTKPDHIAVTGDLTHLSLPAEFKKAKEWLESLGSPSQVTVIPGNHDTYVHTDWHETMARWTEYMISDTVTDRERTIENVDQIFPSLRIRDCVALIGVCTAQPCAPHLAVGSIGELQLHRLGKILSQTASQKYFRVLLVHHPPVPGMVSWRKRLTDAAALQPLIADFGAELIFHGHAHREHKSYMKASFGSVPVMSAPSITALAHLQDRRARYYIYHISRDAGGWNVRRQVRIYSSDKNCFVGEHE